MRAKLSKSLLLLILSLMMSTLCFGQYPISTSILLSPPYPTNLDAYVDMLNDGVVSIENSSASTIDVYFDVSIEETNGRLKVSSKGILPNPIAVSPGMMTLSPSDIEDLFAGVGENNLETNGLSSAEQNAFLLSRQVPEGNYKICMSAFDVNGQPLNDPNVDPCAYFEVVYAERPVILFPTDKDNVEPTEFVNISWAHDVFSLKANEIEYIVKVLDLTEQKIVNIQDAMLNNGVSPEYEENVGAIKFLALQNNFDMPFEQGHKYAIRVTASDPNGSLAFQYGGHSEIVTFTYESVFEEEEEEESSFPMAELEVPESGYLNMEQDPLAFPVTWSHDFKESDTAGLLSTLTYRIKVIDMDTLKITSIDKKDFENDQYAYIWNKDVTEENFILMSDSAHTLVRGHQYAFILQVESSDDRVSFDNDGFSELVKVIIGEEPKEKKDPEEACGSTCIATLPTDQVEVPMKKNKDYTIGKLTLRTNKITKEDNGYNGSGYITLNFVKSVKVKVNFIGLKANKGMEIFSGTAQGANDEGAKLDGLVATAGSMAGLDFDAAKALAPALRNGGKLISALAGKETGLPLGIDSKVGQDEMIVGITEIMITPKRASLTALFSIENPEWGDYIPTLGATDICFSRDGFGEVVKLFLGKDYSIPMAGDHMVLKASENNAAEEKGCYAIIDCNGFKEGQITAEIGIPREILIPENEEGDIQENGMAKLTLSGTFQSSKNFILSASMSPCQIPGLEGYSFEMENGFYDASDDINPAGIIFPQGYERTATGKTWKGVWFSNVLLKAPKDWGFASEEDRTTIGIKNFIKDDVGISVVASAENILSIEKGNIEGFAISIDEISLKIIRNDFEEVKIEGKMGMPILSEGQYLPYEGIIDREEIKDKDNKTTKTTAMSFSVKPNPDGYDLDWIKSKLTFDESTEIVLKSNSKQRGVEAKLSGNLTLGGTAETLNSNRDVGMPEIDIPGIKFEGMEISKMKDLTIKTPSNSKAKDKNGGFKFVKPKFSFMGVKLALIEDATRIDIDVPDKTKETPDGDKKDPKVNGFSYNLTAMDLSFGEDGQGSASEISNGTKVSFALAGEFSLVRGKKGAAKKKNEGLAISASGGFTLESKVQIEGTKTSFKFEKFKMDSLSVDAQVSAIGIEGKVIFYNEVYQLPAPEILIQEKHTKVIMYSYKTLNQMDKKDKIRACYQHCCLRYVSNDKMTNQSLRDRFQIESKNAAIASRIIKEALTTKVIKEDDPESNSRKYKKYIPIWA